MRFSPTCVLLAAALAVALSPGSLAADPDDDEVPPFAQRVDLSGPRFGVSLLSPGIVDKIAHDSNQQVGIVLAAGKTFRAGALNLPVNLALVPSASGVRLTLLCGFNTRR
jgi:hypothetical protein